MAPKCLIRRPASPWYERTKEGQGMAEKLITPICVLGAKRSKIGKIPTTFNMYYVKWMDPNYAVDRTFLQRSD